MQQGVRAVEAYRRSLLIDGVTSDDDRIAPVYKLDEICTTIRTSPELVRDFLDLILKRLDHKSPLVKQKALRLIKVAAGKAGPDFKRETQRHSSAVRSLFHYRGQPDALKGDALNKAVRDTAHEAVSAMFASEEKISERRIQGFGSSNFDMPFPDEKKTMFSGMMGFGSSTIRSSISMMSGAGSGGGSNGGSSYREQSLRRSLTAERETFQEEGDSMDSQVSAPFDPNVEYGNGRGSHSDGKGNSQEARLLDTVTAPGGVRLQPSRDAIQNFLSEAVKLDAVKLGHALEAKLQAHSWQVRFKAMCLAEALVKQKESKVFGTIVAMLEEDAVAIHECAQSPQASLREKSRKVLDLLGLGDKDGFQEEGEHPRGTLGRIPPPPGSALPPPPPPPPVVLPDLIDTTEFDFPVGSGGLESVPTVAKLEEALGDTTAVTSSASVTHDNLFGGFQWSDDPAEIMNESVGADPFAGMSLNTSSAPAAGPSAESNLFSGLNVDSNADGSPNGLGEGLGSTGSTSSSLFEGLTVSSGEMAVSASQAAPLDGLVDLMGGFSTESPLTDNHMSDTLQSLSTPNFSLQQPVGSVPVPSLGSHSLASKLPGGSFPPSLNGGGFFNQSLGAQMPEANLVVPLQVPAGTVQPQMIYVNPAVLMNMGIPGGGFPPHMLLQQGFAPGALGYSGMSAAYAQQQLAAGLASMQRHGMGMDMGPGSGLQGNLRPGSGAGLSYNDGFDFSSDATPRYSAIETRKEDTKAFDFISDHVSAVLGPKKSK